MKFYKCDRCGKELKPKDAFDVQTNAAFYDLKEQDQPYDGIDNDLCGECMDGLEATIREFVTNNQ